MTVLGLALVAGLGAGRWLASHNEGGGWSSAPIEWDAVQAVPRALSDADDAAWLARGRGDGAGGRGSGSAGSAVRASFAACKWGGGTNCVVDGDTFYLGGNKIRIAGIDAPETHDYGCAGELALGEQAAARLQQLLNSGAVSLSSIDRDRDRYGRLLRNAAVDGRGIGETLIGEGLARPYAGGRQPWC